MWWIVAPFVYMGLLLVELCFLAAELFVWGCLVLWDLFEDARAEGASERLRASESPAVVSGYPRDAIDGSEGLEGRTERLEGFW